MHDEIITLAEKQERVKRGYQLIFDFCRKDFKCLDEITTHINKNGIDITKERVKQWIQDIRKAEPKAFQLEKSKLGRFYFKTAIEHFNPLHIKKKVYKRKEKPVYVPSPIPNSNLVASWMGYL